MNKKYIVLGAIMALVAGTFLGGTSVFAKLNKQAAFTTADQNQTTEYKENKVGKIDKTSKKPKSYNMSFSGTVASGDSTNGWVVTTKKNGSITVIPDSNIKYFVITKGHKGKTAGTSADVMTGSIIQTRGSWDGTIKTLSKVLTLTVIK